MIEAIVRLLTFVILSGGIIVALIALMNLWGEDAVGPPKEPCAYCEDTRGAEPMNTRMRDPDGDPICKPCAIALGFEP